jgi:uncharacterized protein YoxC
MLQSEFASLCDFIPHLQTIVLDYLKPSSPKPKTEDYAQCLAVYHIDPYSIRLATLSADTKRLRENTKLLCQDVEKVRVHLNEYSQRLDRTSEDVKRLGDRISKQSDVVPIPVQTIKRVVPTPVQTIKRVVPTPVQAVKRVVPTPVQAVKRE